MFRATFRGRELLYPEPFGSVTAGADKDYPVDYSHLNIMGYALGAKGVEPDPDKATFQADNIDEFVKSRKYPVIVIPAKAGIQ